MSRIPRLGVDFVPRTNDPDYVRVQPGRGYNYGTDILNALAGAAQAFISVDNRRRGKELAAEIDRATAEGMLGNDIPDLKTQEAQDALDRALASRAVQDVDTDFIVRSYDPEGGQTFGEYFSGWLNDAYGDQSHVFQAEVTNRLLPKLGAMYQKQVSDAREQLFTDMTASMIDRMATDSPEDYTPDFNKIKSIGQKMGYSERQILNNTAAQAIQIAAQNGDRAKVDDLAALLEGENFDAIVLNSKRAVRDVWTQRTMLDYVRKIDGYMDQRRVGDWYERVLRNDTELTPDLRMNIQNYADKKQDAARAEQQDINKESFISRMMTEGANSTMLDDIGSAMMKPKADAEYIRPSIAQSLLSTVTKNVTDITATRIISDVMTGKDGNPAPVGKPFDDSFLGICATRENPSVRVDVDSKGNVALREITNPYLFVSRDVMSLGRPVPEAVGFIANQCNSNNADVAANGIATYLTFKKLLPEYADDILSKMGTRAQLRATAVESESLPQPSDVQNYRTSVFDALQNNMDLTLPTTSKDDLNNVMDDNIGNVQDAIEQYASTKIGDDISLPNDLLNDAKAEIQNQLKIALAQGMPGHEAAQVAVERATNIQLRKYAKLSWDGDTILVNTNGDVNGMDKDWSDLILNDLMDLYMRENVGKEYTGEDAMTKFEKAKGFAAKIMDEYKPTWNSGRKAWEFYHRTEVGQRLETKKGDTFMSSPNAPSRFSSSRLTTEDKLDFEINAVRTELNKIINRPSSIETRLYGRDPEDAQKVNQQIQELKSQLIDLENSRREPRKRDPFWHTAD